MPSINILSRELSELIAAGEVIERPASVIKELIENSIDAGARHITVEIKRGGTTYMRITDDGCGISYDDVPKAFLRHATSKISVKSDLSEIMTLGFRGEALASVCAVSKTEIMTKQKEDELGTHFRIDGSIQSEYEKIGCPDGTTIMIRDLFYNVPARQKFMKKDTAEGNMVCSIVSKIALSHPDISVKLIRDNKCEFVTPGDGKLYSSVYSVYGRQYAGDLIDVSYQMNGVNIKGLCIKPLYSKSNRTYQDFFVNGRYIKSSVCSCAIEEAYRGLIMTGKFPACVLMIDISPDVVDVNVHPAKVEIKFSQDKPVYDCIYFAVKSALMKCGLVYDFKLKTEHTSNNQSEEYVQPTLTKYCEDESKACENKTEKIDETPVNTNVSCAGSTAAEVKTDLPENINISGEQKCEQMPVSAVSAKIGTTYTSESASEKNADNEAVQFSNEKSEAEKIRKENKTAALTRESRPAAVSGVIRPPVISSKESYSYINESSFIKKTEPVPVSHTVEAEDQQKEIIYIGEAFKGYILAQADNKIIIIDKHAAHERIIFERLKSQQNDPASQFLISPAGMLMSLDEASVLQENEKILSDMGFAVDCKASPYISVKAVPVILSELDIEVIMHEIAANLLHHKKDPGPSAIDDIFHTMACKAAIKANDKNSPAELEQLARDVYTNDKIRHCPHGRPVMFTISKYDLEKQFRRIV